MPKSDHCDLHRLMNDFMRGIKDAFGNDMYPRNGNSGADIRSNFTRPQILDALSQFYNGPGAQFADAVGDFFGQHPDLLSQTLNPHPSLGDP